MMPLVSPAGIPSDAAARPAPAIPDATGAQALNPPPSKAAPAGSAIVGDFEAALSLSAPKEAQAPALPAGLGERFEAAMLSPLVEAMLPPEGSAVWGGNEGETWRGFYARELAAAIARSGGIGIADILDRSAGDGIGWSA